MKVSESQIGNLPGWRCYREPSAHVKANAGALSATPAVPGCGRSSRSVCDSGQQAGIIGKVSLAKQGFEGTLKDRG